MMNLFFFQLHCFQHRVAILKSQVDRVHQKCKHFDMLKRKSVRKDHKTFSTSRIQRARLRKDQAQ